MRHRRDDASRLRHIWCESMTHIGWYFPRQPEYHQHKNGDYKAEDYDRLDVDGP